MTGVRSSRMQNKSEIENLLKQQCQEIYDSYDFCCNVEVQQQRHNENAVPGHGNISRQNLDLTSSTSKDQVIRMR